MCKKLITVLIYDEGLLVLCFYVTVSSQMLLPDGIKRENNKMYEEVEIPPNEPMPIGFEEKPVYISELDEVSGTALDIQQPLCSHFMCPSQTLQKQFCCSH